MNFGSKLLAVSLLTFSLMVPAKAQTNLKPVLARVEVRFSIVSHYIHIESRKPLYAGNGGAANFAIPYLVYEPLVTLYNPYNSRIQLNLANVKLEDPPVLFKFKKNGAYLRTDWEKGPGHGLGRFNISLQNSQAARKTFTMSLGGGTANNYGTPPIVLEPGEWKRFASRVDSNWTWGLETAGEFTPRSFADWYPEDNFTNRDGRTRNNSGAEFIPVPYPPISYDAKAGFQTDHLSQAYTRPANTKYPFEFSSEGWVAIQLADTFSVEASPGKSFTGGAGPDFRLWNLDGQPLDFNAESVIPPAAPIEKTRVVADILQQAQDLSPGGKTVFANFSMIAGATALRQQLFQGRNPIPDSSLYQNRLSAMSLFYDDTINRPSDALTAGVELLKVERVGDFLMVDFAGPPDRPNGWIIKGTSDLSAGFNDILPISQNPILEGPPGLGFYKAKIHVATRGPRYFIQIGFEAGP